MKAKVLIEITERTQKVEILGSPPAILVEFSNLLSKHSEIVFILSTALKFHSVLDKDFKIWEALNRDSKEARPNLEDYSAEAFAIIDEFTEHYYDRYIKKS